MLRLHHLTFILIVWSLRVDGRNSRLAEPINRLSNDLIKKVDNLSKRNVLYSPLSIMTALGMLLAGARGETAFQMRQQLHLRDAFPANGDINYAFNRLLDEYRQLDKSGTVALKLANLALMKEDFNIYTKYLRILQRDFGATVTAEDFKNSVPIMKGINEWVSASTNGQIKELLTEPLDVATVLVLINAMYFKGKWEKPFNPRGTVPFIFYTGDKVKKQVDTMNIKERFNYIKSNENNLHLIEIPYNGNISMYILLPDERYGLEKMIKKLSYENVEKLIKSMKETDDVEIFLPKFKITGEEKLDVLLPKLGLMAPFSRYSDLSGISTKSGLYVSDAMHKATLEVNENGSEGAAVTALHITPYTAPTNPVFNADHPFAFMIRDKITGVNIFAGTLSQPV